MQWQMGNFLNYVEDGFAINPLIYGAIMYKVRSVSQARAIACIGDPAVPSTLPPSHPLTKLTLRPNVYMSWSEMQGLVETYLNLSGNAYLVIDRDNAKMGVPSALWPVRPDRMYFIPENNEIRGYLYVPEGSTYRNGVPLLVEDVIHIKFPNPLDPFEGLGYGMSPMSALARSGDVDNKITKFLKVFFDRGAKPNGLLKYQMPLDDDLVKRIKARWREVYGGVDNWTDVGVLDSGAEYTNIGQSFSEMGFDHLDERNESRILGPFGVPPILIGANLGLKRSTFSNYAEARRAFWEDTMMYELHLSEVEFEYHLQGEDGSYIRYDLSRVPALRENMISMTDAAFKLFQMGTPADQALSIVGIRTSPLPYGDVAYISQNFRDAGQPAGTAPVKKKH